MEAVGGLALDRSITAAVAGRHMDPIRGAQYPMDMGERRTSKILYIFQYLTPHTMIMGSTLRGFATMFAVLSNFNLHPNRKVLP
jgi:hypothetical protein